jgi:glycosyltransferase involved in cell wall biosynthesis
MRNESAVATLGRDAEDASDEPRRSMRKVLVLAYRFPPQGGGGVQRTLKFVKYLPGEGWLPVVHTVANPYWSLQDPTLLAEIPPVVKVSRSRTFEFERFARAAEGLLSAEGTAAARPDRRGAGPGVGPRTDRQAPAAAPRRGGMRRRLLQPLAAFVQRHLLVPDPQITWMPGAFLAGLRAIRRERVALIYTSSPPNSGLVLGLMLKVVTRLPWIADMRDPWTEGIRRKQSYEQSRLRGALDHALERAVFARADHIVLTTEKTLEQYLAKYPRVPREKYSVITNGFDPGDFALGPSSERLLAAGDFNLTLTGNVEAMFDAIPFFSAVKDLVDESEEVRAHLRVNFVGTKRGKYDDFIRDHALDGTVRYIGYVPHQTSLRYLAESDALFLCQIPVYESATTKLSGKLFEYLYMRKPILALTIPGLTTEILSRSGLGTVVDPGDRAGIKKAVRDLYTDWREGRARTTPDEAYIGTFDRVRQTRRLAGLLDRLAGSCP